jgi:hypothetical protein
MPATVTADDEGTQVVTAAGEDVGRVVEVRGDVAHVAPDPDLTDTLAAKLGWADEADADTYRLGADWIDTITDDQVRIRS